MQASLAMFGSLGLPEMIVIGIVALLVFGSRLPEVGRSLGRGLMEFKKGLSGIKDEVDSANLDADRRIDAELERRHADPLLEQPEEAPVTEPETIYDASSGDDEPDANEDERESR